MQKIIGRFFFKLTDSKNLIGEFSNNGCDRNYTESADRITPNARAGKFEGQYFTTWYDYEDGRHEGVLAKLEIKRKPENIFLLKWWLVGQDGNPNGDPNFWGHGMVCDGTLIGDYRNYENP